MKKKIIILMVFVFLGQFFIINNSIYAKNSEKSNYFKELKEQVIQIQKHQNAYSFFLDFKFNVDNYYVDFIYFYNQQENMKDIDNFEMSFNVENKKNNEKLTLNINLKSNNNPNVSIKINNKDISFNDLSPKNKQKIEKFYNKLITKLIQEIKNDTRNTDKKLEKFLN